MVIGAQHVVSIPQVKDRQEIRQVIVSMMLRIVPFRAPESILTPSHLLW